MAPPTTIHPLDTLWEARGVIRVVLAGEALALLLALAPGMELERVTYFGMASFTIQWIGLMALGLLFLGRKRLQNADTLRVAQIALAALLVSTWLVWGLAWSFLRDIWPVPDNGWFGLFLQFSVMALIVGVLALGAFRAHWQVRKFAVRAKQAELDALQARLRPHFLFNTLNTGISLVRGRPEDAERLLLDLSDLFRAAISEPAEVSLDEELSLVRQYLEIESLRFGERLKIHWNVSISSEELKNTRIPSLSLQPLVENSIKHGIEPARHGGRIKIDVTGTPTCVTVSVNNSVPEKGKPAASGHGIGVRAVKARIEGMAGGTGKLEIRSAKDEFTAIITIQARKTDDFRTGIQTV